MMIWPRELTTPEHTLVSPLTGSAVRSPDEWRALQRWVLAQNRARLPKLSWPDPWYCLERPPVHVNYGRWMIHCACGDCPLVHPDWHLSLCLGCGAVYEGLMMPFESDAIEAVLCARPHPSQRNWTTETLDELRAENLAHGDEVPTWPM